MRTSLASYLLAAALAVFPAASFAECNHWDFAAEYLATGNGSDPAATDACGNRVWQFKDSVDRTYTPSNYVALSSFYTEWRPCLPGTGLKLWFNGSVPHVSVNSSGIDQACDPEKPITWNAGAAIVHPAPGSAAVVAWQSPVKGEVVVTYTVADIDTWGGDGIDWFVQTPAAQSSGVLDSGQSTIWQDTVKVERGQIIYFGVGPNGDYFYDTTAVSILIDRP